MDIEKLARLKAERDAEIAKVESEKDAQRIQRQQRREAGRTHIIDQINKEILPALTQLQERISDMRYQPLGGAMIFTGFRIEIGKLYIQAELRKDSSELAFERSWRGPMFVQPDDVNTRLVEDAIAELISKL